YDRPPGENPQGGSPYDRPPGENPQGGSPYDRPPGENPQGGSPYDRPPGENPQGGSPYDRPPGGEGPHGGGSQGGGGPQGPYGGGPQGPYGGGEYPSDPLAGMPPLADPGRRTLARIIDLVLVGVVVWLLTWGLRVNEYMVNTERIEIGRSFTQSVIAAVLYIAYDTYLTARSGQTLGKKWLGMRVADLGNGATPSVQTALVRALVLWLPFWFCCACVWLAVSGGWSYFDRPYRQGLHDKAAKTVVVSIR
ncbi:RDD family protein, partial [Streptomyces sp. NPDC046831]|uniref:RDD family protein n=1 Tax=Streptomyces sp. NPDC046831 TaxID=3154805 RepID=UPI00340D33D9